jgi:hypothetical protein
MAGRKRGHPKTGGRQAGTPNNVPSEIKDLARLYAPDALKELARLASKATSESARVAACKEILDRAYGKAPQALVGDPDNPLEERTQVELIFVDSPATRQLTNGGLALCTGVPSPEADGAN